MRIEFLIAWEDGTWNTVIEDVLAGTTNMQHAADMLLQERYHRAVLITTYSNINLTEQPPRPKKDLKPKWPTVCRDGHHHRWVQRRSTDQLQCANCGYFYIFMKKDLQSEKK